MNRIIVTIAVAMAFFVQSLSARAQDKPNVEVNNYVQCAPQMSATDGPRFQIVVPPSNALPFYRIDIHTGEVRLLSDWGKYRPLLREFSPDDVATQGGANYQLVVHNNAHLYLLNLNTGIVWEYSDGLFERNIFRLMKERR